MGKVEHWEGDAGCGWANGWGPCEGVGDGVKAGAIALPPNGRRENKYEGSGEVFRWEGGANIHILLDDMRAHV